MVLTTVIGSTFLFAQQLSVTRLDGTKISPSQIDTAVTRLMEVAHVTGVGIAVWNNDRVVYLKTYGERNTEKHLLLTLDSVMTAASLTKPAFGTMVMQLVATIRLGNLVKQGALALAGAVTLGALVVSVPSDPIHYAPVNWFHLLCGLFVGAVLLATGYISGTFLAAQGQFMSALLDTAVNTSPHLQDLEKASIMTL